MGQHASDNILSNQVTNEEKVREMADQISVPHGLDQILVGLLKVPALDSAQRRHSFIENLRKRITVCKL